MVGPYFVDWDGLSAAIEAEAARLLGVRVRVLGEAEVRLLPTPSISLDDVRVGGIDAPIVTAQRVEAEIELPSLLRGEVRVTALDFERPQIKIDIDPAGRPRIAPGASNPGSLAPAQVSLDHVSIENGEVAISDRRTGLIRRISAVNATLSARTLAGPYKLEGTALADSVPSTCGSRPARRMPAGSR